MVGEAPRSVFPALLAQALVYPLLRSLCAVVLFLDV